MRNLLLEGTSSFADSYMLLIVLVVIIVGFLLLSLSRRKKEENYRNDLNSKIVPGAMIKTYSGLYGKVISITDTTDGKIVLVQTGEGDKVSYQQLHINAIFGLDTKRELVFDENGNDITFADEENVVVEEVEETEEEPEYEEVEVVEEIEEVEEPVVEEVKKVEKPKTAKKSTSSAKKSTSSTTKSKSTSKKSENK